MDFSSKKAGDFLCKFQLLPKSVARGMDSRVELCRLMAREHPHINFEVRGNKEKAEVWRTDKMGEVFKYEKEPMITPVHVDGEREQPAQNSSLNYTYQSKTCAY